MSMQLRQLAPVVIFAFNRPERLQRLLQSLRRCPEWESSYVRVYVDGPRHAGEAEAVAAVAALARAEGLDCRVRPCNIGLQKSVVSGISELLSEYEKVIVLEDDLEVSPGLLAYFNESLNKYESNESVMSVCADLPELKAPPITNVFLPFGSSWGWATWTRAWSRFSLEPGLSPCARKAKSFRQRFGAHGLRDFSYMLWAAESGLINSWYVYWQLAITRFGGISAFPPVPLVRNMGLSGGTHGGRFNLLRFVAFDDKEVGEFDFDLLDRPEINFEVLQEVIDSREWKLLRLNSWLGGKKRTTLRRLGIS